MKTRKTLIWVLVAVGAVAGVLFLVGGRSKSEPKYRTSKVDRGTVTKTVTATGALSAVTTVAVGSQVSGIIARLHADFNSQVKKGDLLAELDPTPFEARVEQSRAALQKAQIELRNAEISLRRQEALRQQQLTPQADYDQAKADADVARASVRQASAALDQALTDLRYTKIEAPIDGVVVARQYDVGQTVAASFQAPTLFTIAQDLTKMQVAADIAESDIGGVKVGQPVRFNVDAYPEREFRGRVSQIRLNATVNQNVVTYPVIVEVSNPEMLLRPTMTANVTIDVESVRDVLRIPNAALRFRPEVTDATSAEERAARTGSATGPAAATRQFGRTAGGGRAGAVALRPQTVYAAPAEPDGDPKPVAIRTGITDGRYTQVVSGDLKEGDAVVTGVATARAQISGTGPAGRGAGGGGRRGF
ncbi:MAG: efflux RND transporter periplasmic adaptor subunit [Thermoanaerobaculia bacterium]